MAVDPNYIKNLIDENIKDAPPAAPRSNTAQSIRGILKQLVDWVTGNDYTPDHDWNGTQLRFKKANGVNGVYTDLKGAKGDKGDQGNPGTLTASVLPARTTPISRVSDKMVIQRSDGVLEKVTLFQLAGGYPLVTGNLIANGNTEFGDLSNMLPGDSSKLSFDGTQSPPAGGKGAFKYTGANGFLRTIDLIPVNLLRRHRLSMVARHGDTSGANYDTNARGYFGIICYDADGLEITPPHFAKVTGAALTTLAAPLNPGATTMTLVSSSGWYNGSSASNRGFAWYPYTNGQGQVFADYGYSRNVSSNYNVYWQSNGGAWAQGGITGNVVTLTSPWPGPALPAGTKMANVMEGGTYMYSGVLNNGLVPNAWTLYECFIQGANPGNSEDVNNLMFRPGTAFIRPILLINYNNPATTTTFYLTMLDFREAGFDQATLLAGANTFSGANAFNGDVTLKRLILVGNSPSIAANAVNSTGAGVGATASITAGSTDQAGNLTLTTGATPGTNVLLATITFATALAAAPKAVMLTARNNQAGMSIARFFVGNKTATGFTIQATDVGPVANTTFSFDYIVLA
ncbi:hypothetical protein GCM10028803_53340 [Larkinella knui]|uniref:Tail fiber protein n=1 Tax=Larkinella knui TaxID=2025310 RepID=A0A3P1CGH2_9BACT|nr:hypothetical protein [Larkinella knui]RRB12459.1 hypothetical protein EHT87_19870 [Larkinella knui]